MDTAWRLVPRIFRYQKSLGQFTSTKDEETRHIRLEIYQSLKISPEECIECRSCVERCPVGIDIPKRLKEAVEFFREVMRTNRIDDGSPSGK